MADTVYRIRIDYTANTAEAERGAARVSSGFGGIKAAIVGAAAALGISQLASKIFEIGRKAEDAKIAIAGMMQASGAGGLTGSADDFNKSMAMSAEIIKQMRKDARDLPGEFEDLANIFRMGIGGGIGAGKSINEIEKLSAKLMAFGAMNTLQSEQVGREFAMMMEGRAGAHNVLWQRLTGGHGDAKKFNAMGQPEKFAAIEKYLKGYEPAIKAFGNTWSAVESTTEDFAKQIFRIGTAPVFDAVKRHLSDWNDWFQKNQEYVERMATTWGTELAGGLETAYGWAKSLVGVIVDNRETLLKIAEAYIGFKGMSAFGGGGGGASGVAGNMIGGAGMGVAISGMFGHITETGGTLNATMMGLEGAFSRLPGPLGLVSSALLVFHGAIQAAADEIDKGHKLALNKDVETQRLMGAYKAFELNGQKDDIFAFDKRAQLIAKEMQLFKKDGSVDKMRLGAYVGGLTNVDPVGYMGALHMFQALGKYHPDNKTPYGPDMPTPEQFALNRAMPPKPPPGNTNVNIQIVQTIENANDPDRVLVKTKEAMESIYRHETVSPYNRFATVR